MCNYVFVNNHFLFRLQADSFGGNDSNEIPSPQVSQKSTTNRKMADPRLIASAAAFHANGLTRGTRSSYSIFQQLSPLHRQIKLAAMIGNNEDAKKIYLKKIFLYLRAKNYPHMHELKFNEILSAIPGTGIKVKQIIAFLFCRLYPELFEPGQEDHNNDFVRIVTDAFKMHEMDFDQVVIELFKFLD